MIIKISPSSKLIMTIAAYHFFLANILLYIAFQMLMYQSYGLIYDVLSYILIVLFFPVRNIVNSFMQRGDSWIFHPTFLLVIAVSSAFWGVIIFVCMQYFKKIRSSSAGSIPDKK